MILSPLPYSVKERQGRNLTCTSAVGPAAKMTRISGELSTSIFPRSLHSALPRNTATQRENFAPFLSNHVINIFFSFLFFSLFFLSFPLLTNSSRIFSPKHTKSQGAVIFTFLQCISVLSYNKDVKTKLPTKKKASVT